MYYIGTIKYLLQLCISVPLGKWTALSKLACSKKGKGNTHRKMNVGGGFLDENRPVYSLRGLMPPVGPFRTHLWRRTSVPISGGDNQNPLLKETISILSGEETIGGKHLRSTAHMLALQKATLECAFCCPQVCTAKSYHGRPT